MGLVLRYPLAVPAVMGAASVCAPDRTAAADRGPLPCVCGAWGCALVRAGKLPPHHPAHPRPAAVGLATLAPGSRPHAETAGPRGSTTATKTSLQNLPFRISEKEQVSGVTDMDDETDKQVLHGLVQ
jgi:hypothetical protein